MELAAHQENAERRGVEWSEVREIEIDGHSTIYKIYLRDEAGFRYMDKGGSIAQIVRTFEGNIEVT